MKQRLNPIDQTLHRQFSEYGRNAKEWLRKCALLLPEIEKRQVWKKHGCSSIYEYAAKVAGMGRATIDEALWVLRKIEDKPLLQKVVEQKGIRSVKPIANLATLETESFWAEKAKSMSVHILETYAKNYREELWHVPKTQPGKPSDEMKVEFTVKEVLGKKLEQIKKRADFEALLEQFVQSVEEQDEAEKPEAVETRSRHIPIKIQRYVEKKTGELCAYPGCTKPATSLHHTQRWALEKVHDPSRLHGLCTAHERLAHKGLIAHEEEAPEKWKLRKEPDKADDKFYVDTLVSLYRRSE